jgi:hypothetical protein
MSTHQEPSPQSAVVPVQTPTQVPEPAVNPSSEFDKRRADFLQKMYAQMFDDIKVQLQIVWQAVAVVAGTFGLFALVEKGVIPLDVAVSVIVLIASWLIAHVIEASYWYNRNLVIIANIERQFLRRQDLHDIHYYFGKHRQVGTMIYHLWIQFLFGACIAGVVLFYHFSARVIPGFGASLSGFELSRCIPYIVTMLAIGVLLRHKWYKDSEYKEFLKNSPGITIDTQGIEYGTGHPAHVVGDAVGTDNQTI